MRPRSTLFRGRSAEYGEQVAEDDRSPELDQVRRLLFPNLTEEEGWARIDTALDGAADPKRVDEIDRLADDQLAEALLDELRRPR
jgi:hypothetical protein